MVLTLLSFVFVFLVVTVAHELGHLLWAKRAGIRVYQFGLGLGPQVFSFKRGETLYSLHLFPIAGFVRLAGIEPEAEEEKECPEEEKYYNKTPAKKFKAIVAGPLFNILLSFVIIYFILVIVGMPTGISNEIASVVPDSPAQKVGLKVGDRIEAIDGQKIENMAQAIETIHKSAEKVLTLTISRAEESLEVEVTPQYNPQMKVALIGFSPKPLYQKINPLTALWVGAQQTVGMVVFILWLLGQLIMGRFSLLDLAGPVGIAQATGRFAAHGPLALFQFIAFLSVNLGVVNLLPIPALDGGRLCFVLLEAVRRKAIDIKKENAIHRAGLILLLGLMVVLTINDILRMVRK